MQFIKFKKNIILGIKKSFESIKEDNDHIYCYSLVVSSELSCIGAAANTIDYLNENIDEEDEIMYYKFCEQEWEFYNETNEYLDSAKEQINKFIKENESLISNKDTCYYSEFFEEFREKIFDTCVRALYEVKDSSFFDSFSEDGGFINFMIPEYLGQEESVEIFKKLNKDNVVKEYTENIDEFI